MYLKHLVLLLAVALAGCAADLSSEDGEDSNATCDDGIDNDGDGFVDCNDRSCSRNATVTVCGTESNDEWCSDGIDNDGNGYIDCQDFACSRNDTVTVCADVTCDPSQQAWPEPDALEPNPGDGVAESALRGNFDLQNTNVIGLTTQFHASDDVDYFAWTATWVENQHLVCRLSDMTETMRVALHMRFLNADGELASQRSELLENDGTHAMLLGPLNGASGDGHIVVGVVPDSETLDSCNTTYRLQCKLSDSPNW